MVFHIKIILYFLVVGRSVVCGNHLSAQTSPQPLFKVFTLTGENQGSREIPQDHGLDGHLAKVIETANRILANLLSYGKK
jgi:hypothetical protein